MNKIYILTEEYNDYDQHGEYFVAWFPRKPTASKLGEVIFPESEGPFSEDVVVEYLSHILNGGGRRGIENHWYHLRKVKAGKRQQ